MNDKKHIILTTLTKVLVSVFPTSPTSLFSHVLWQMDWPLILISVLVILQCNSIWSTSFEREKGGRSLMAEEGLV